MSLQIVADNTALHDVDIEQLVLGLALFDTAILDEAAGSLSPYEFFDPLHQRIFDAMLGLRQSGKIVTPLTVKAALAGDKGLAEVGTGYLNSIALTASRQTFVADIGAYTAIIKDLALRRDCRDALSEALERLRSPSTPVFDVMTSITALADRAADADSAAKEIANPGLAAMLAIEAAERLGRNALIGAPTGIRALDAVIGGLCPGELIVLAGNSGMGKSAAAGVMARAAAWAGYQVEIFSLEMTHDQFAVRMACEIDYHERGLDQLPLSYSRLLKGKASEREKDRAMAAAALLQNANIKVHDRPNMTMEEIASIARARAAKAKRPVVIIIDHLQIVAVSDRYRGNRVQEVTEQTRQAKALAKRLNAPVLLLSQLNRENTKRQDPRPILADLRESGSIEQDADVVLGLYRPAYAVEHKRPALREMDPGWTDWLAEYREVKNKFEIIVLKNRMGELSKIACHCDMGASAITDADFIAGAPAPTEDEGMLL